MRTVTAHAFLVLQHLLPKYLSTRLMYRLSHIETTGIKNFMIRRFTALYPVDIDEAARPVPDGYRSFNDFFTRELADGARPIDESADSVVAPADGTVSAAGRIEHDRLLQAKGHRYSLADLLATDLDDAAAYVDGSFATIYLAPYDYHRVHAPLAGRLLSVRYVPGDLFSVNSATVSLLPGLFARNERLVLSFDTAFGPVAVILVGALHVGSITTPWTGELRPRRDGMVELLRLDPSVPRDVSKGGLLGWFNFGSTVIVLLPRGACDWRDALVTGMKLRVGERIGTARAARR
ncbi:MAG: archaetidylserine decarboxylase [Gammaproteobacteria bacterium]|nr:archaetidylserine decarboxylase [Gammaproteobacteria bacterium]MDH4254225.1 archaetidylserine decarboxylase [Gammaproteobacteria bacterium]MDH5310495.1 archaetidylserine decarboxylase [Gammaproteobacteria bacterium]